MQVDTAPLYSLYSTQKLYTVQSIYSLTVGVVLFRTFHLTFFLAHFVGWLFQLTDCKEQMVPVAGSAAPPGASDAVTAPNAILPAATCLHDCPVMQLK